MKKKDDDKGMLNEVLPDPTKGVERGTPRERTASHLNRLLAAAGLALAPGLARADNTVPGGKPPGDSKPGGKGKPDDANKKPEPRPEPPGYGVVDPMPEPYIEKKAAPGFLNITTRPSCSISIDGKATGLKTPQSKIKLAPGMHTITLTLPSNAVAENFTVEIQSNRTETVVRKFDPPPKPEPDKKDPKTK